MPLSRQAFTTTEYLIILCGLSVVILCGFWIVNHAELTSFRQTSQALGNTGNLAGEGDLPVSEGDIPAANARAPSRSPTTTIAFLSIAGCFLAIGTSAACVFFLRWRELQKERKAIRHRQMVREQDEQSLHRRMLEKRTQLDSVLRNQWSHVVKAEIQVGDLMSSKLVYVSPSTAIEDALQLMEEQQVHHLLVLDTPKTLVGIISDRDIRGRRGDTAVDIMTADPLVVTPETDIKQAISIILRNQYSALPVVENGQAVGMLTSNDLIATLHCTLARLCDTSYALRSQKLHSEAMEHVFGHATRETVSGHVS